MWSQEQASKLQGWQLEILQKSTRRRGAAFDETETARFVFEHREMEMEGGLRCMPVRIKPRTSSIARPN